ncbi:MAG: PAS domain S-box protein, partial [Thermodesulfobacteriota bacterium]|nr:PAS domain S-box protein [Thermodesulfobacteriota bacterium]
QKTGNINTARDAGRYVIYSKAYQAVNQYALGFITPANAYSLAQKLSANISRAITLKTKKLGANKIEFTSTPKPGVREKPYQCENRIGLLEALAQVFTKEYPNIEHPTCIHRGGDCCRYIITWKKIPSLIWRLLRNYITFLSLIAFTVLFFVLPAISWVILILLDISLILGLSFYSESLRGKELTNAIETQGDAAKNLLDEMNVRYNDTLLIQEIGQVSSMILDIDKLLKSVTKIMEKRSDFDRGMIMLSNKEKTRLLYTAGYGYTKDQKGYLRQIEFHLDKPDSRGTFVLAFKEQKPFLVNDISEIEKDLSKKSLGFTKKVGSTSFICVPIVYRKESLGVLAVDNLQTKRPLTQSDMNLLMGIASQIAIGITNAISFEKLQESEKKYRDLVENANSIILRIDTQGNITFFNEFAQVSFGYTEDEILGWNAVKIIASKTELSQHDISMVMKDLAAHPEQYVIFESENTRKSGEHIWITWTTKPIFDSNGQIVEILCIGNDITKLKKSELEKNKLEAQLQRAQKMEAVGRLAGGVAHDLNNILTGIVSYPDLLLMQIPEDSRLRKSILAIQQSGEKAAAIVQDLLTLARRGVTFTEAVNLNSIISDYLRSPEHEKLMEFFPNVEFKAALETDLLNTLGSRVHLSKTIMNLISNAAEAISPEGGKVSISTANRYVDQPIKGYDHIKEGDYIVLSVTDTGKGISSDDLSKIFEPFYTKKVMGRSGTGLGLSVVWGTVKDHKGYIDVKSVEGKGTRFDLHFPATRKEVPKKEGPASIENYMGNEKILAVDDIKEQRDVVFELLSSLGYSVTTVSSGEKAVEYMKNDSADLVVLDMIMDTGIDGLETYKRIIELHPGQKAIIVSGFSETDRVKKAQELGVGAYVKKPYVLEKLGMAVRAELDR